MTEWPEYDPATAFAHELVVAASEVDAYGHVNNVAYLAWLDACAWKHATSVGLGLGYAMASRRGLAVRTALLDYLGAARRDDAIVVRTWVIANDGRLSGTRRFDVMCGERRVLRARIDYVMLNLATLKPTRMTEPYRLRLPAVSAVDGEASVPSRIAL